MRGAQPVSVTAAQPAMSHDTGFGRHRMDPRVRRDDNKWRRAWKLDLIARGNPNGIDLYDTLNA